jgi:hypothetical protein
MSGEERLDKLLNDNIPLLESVVDLTAFTNLTYDEFRKKALGYLDDCTEIGRLVGKVENTTERYNRMRYFCGLINQANVIACGDKS